MVLILLVIIDKVLTFLNANPSAMNIGLDERTSYSSDSQVIISRSWKD